MKPKLVTVIELKSPFDKIHFGNGSNHSLISEQCSLRIKITPIFFPGGPVEVECGMRLRIKDQQYLKFDKDQFEIYNHYGIINSSISDFFDFKLKSLVSKDDLLLLIKAIVKVEVMDCKYADRIWYNSVMWALT